jgi:hypothetical protein
VCGGTVIPPHGLVYLLIYIYKRAKFFYVLKVFKKI